MWLRHERRTVYRRNRGYRLPLGNGILTVETEAQALERADPARGDKGGDAARAALALLRMQRQVEAR